MTDVMRESRLPSWGRTDRKWVRRGDSGERPGDSEEPCSGGTEVLIVIEPKSGFCNFWRLFVLIVVNKPA